MNNTLLRFEQLKFIKKKKNILLFIFLLLIILLIIFANNFMNNKVNEQREKEIKFEISSIHDAIKQLPSSTSLTKVEEIKKNYEEDADLLQKRLDALKKGNWQEYNKAQLTFDKKFIKNLSDGTVIGGEPEFEVKKRIEINTLLLKKDIEPYNEASPTKGLYFLNFLLNILFNIGGSLIILLFVSDYISSEFESGTIKLLLTQPISKLNIFFSKYLSAVLTITFIFLLLGVFSFIITSSISGTGSLHYPVALFQENGIESIPLGKFMAESSLFFLLVICFIVSLSFLFSILTKNSILATGTSIITTILFYYAINNTEFFNGNGITKFIPFTYINPLNVIDHSLAIKLNDSHINLTNGSFILVLSSILILLASSLLIKKLKIFNG